MSTIISPIFSSASADFAALLQDAINREDECDECLPGATLRISETQTQATEERTPSATQSRQHKRRRIARNKTILDHGFPSATEKYLKSAQVVQAALDTANLPVASGAHTALNKPVPCNPGEVPEIQHLVESGFEYISCGENGIPSRFPRPIVDSKGRIIALIAGAPPQDTSYDKHAHDLFKIIIEESNSNTFTTGELHHKRGDFPAINFGFTLPNGFKHPINLENQRHEEKISRICSCLGFSRISMFQNAAFAFWNPGVYTYQKSRIEQLIAHNPELKRTTAKTIFPTTACNFRNVCCHKHRDTQNCPFGWCGITALGEFDHTRGGHIILWELKLVIEFPHGYTVLIPSATITHSNIPVVNGDVRVSITQYCAGSIFRYVDNGFRTDKALRDEDRLRYEETQALKVDRWKLSLGLLSTIQDLETRKLPYVSEFQ